MKKSLVALAALAAVGAASAQVTMYGRLDVGYAQNTTTATAAGTGATTDTKNNGINTNGQSTSLWGIKGTEDLGGGLSASFNLESDVAMDSGQTGQAAGANVTAGAPAFNRISTLGLSGGFGSVMMGRYYSPLFLTTLASDVFGAGGAYTVNLLPTVRASDAVFYTSPDLSGLKVSLMLGRNDLSAGAVAATSGNTGLSLNYAAGPLFASLALDKIEGTAGAVSNVTDSTGLTVTYDFGVAKLYTGYIRSQATPNTTASDTYTTQSETNIGVSVPMGAVTLLAQYGRNAKDNTAAGVTDSQSGSDLVVGAQYDLSKRTNLYIKTGTVNSLGNTAITAGSKTATTALGVRHFF